MSDYQTLFDEFCLPEQDSKKLSFCGIKPKQLQLWLDELSTTQVKQTSIVLYKLLPEVNHLDISGSHRLGLMSILRPYVQHCIDGLAEDFLKQPLNLTENMTKIAAIAQALQRHTCDGYMLVIKQLLQTDKLSDTAAQELSLALYYATHGLGQLLYRSYQLYVPRPPMLWKKLHQLQLLAVNHHVDKKQIPDELLQSCKSLSIRQAYIRSLLLACSHNNQLRQIDIQYLYHTLEGWSSMASLLPAIREQAHVYWLNTLSDDGPFYKSRFPEIEDGNGNNGICALNLNNLIDLLGSHHKASDEDKVTEIPIHLRQSLLAHLRICWSQEHDRTQSRQQADIKLEVCIGLKAAHQQLLGETTFDDFLTKHGAKKGNSINMIDSGLNSFTNRPLSAESACYDSPPRKGEFTLVTATDISDQGYCLRWSQEVPPQIKSGEIILLKKPGTNQWQAGSIRWAQRLNRHTYVGVQILDGYAQASAASTKLKNGTETPFFRTVLLRNEHSSEVSSLITPTIPFAPHQEIQLETENQSQQAKLHHLLLSSGSVSQYSYQSL